MLFKVSDLLRLFISTAKIGGVTIGGGYAMVPIMEREFVSKKFISEDEFSNVLVLAQSLPGPIAVNTTTMVGYRYAGIAGAIVSVIGTIFFPFTIILLIASLIGTFKEFLQPFLSGMRTVVLPVLIIAVIRLWKKNVTSKEGLVIFIVASFLTIFLKFNPVLLILLSLLYGFLRGVVSENN